MTIPAGSTVVYNLSGNALREDLEDIIYDISPQDTIFMSSIGRGTAKSTLHEWQIDALAAPSDEIVMTYAQVAERLNKADDADKLAVAASLIATVADEAQRKELSALYDRRAAELNPA